MPLLEEAEAVEGTECEGGGKVFFAPFLGDSAAAAGCLTSFGLGSSFALFFRCFRESIDSKKNTQRFTRASSCYVDV